MAKPRPRWEKVSGQCIQHRIKQVHRTELPLVASASKFVNKAPVTGDVWYVGCVSTSIILEHGCPKAIR